MWIVSQVQDVRYAYERLLDLAFVSDIDKIELFESPYGSSKLNAHHKPFVIAFDCLSNTDDIAHNRCYYDFNSCNRALINARLVSVEWAMLLAVLY